MHGQQNVEKSVRATSCIFTCAYHTNLTISVGFETVIVPEECPT